MIVRTKDEQKAYLDGYEMCAKCIEGYLSDEGKQKLECLLSAVRNAIEIEDIESKGMKTPEIEDVVKVVRCKDCIHSVHWYGDHQLCTLWSDGGVGVFNDGFCNYGKKSGDK